MKSTSLPRKELTAKEQVEKNGKNVHPRVKCPVSTCNHMGAVCLGTRGGHWMTMQCLECDFVFSIDGE